MKGLSFSQVRLSTLTALVVITIVLINAVRYVLGQGTALKGNVDDFFIALNAGYAVVQEGLAHPSIHSPFGVVYFFLSSNSFRLIEAFPQWLSLDKIHMITSVQWMAVISALFIALRQLQVGPKRFPLWLLAVLLVICVQAKDVAAFNPLPNWYGTYNYLLWALLILQAANHYCWKGAGPKGWAILSLGAVEAAILVLEFNYKISFFVAGCVLSLLPMFYLAGWRARAAYYGALLASAAVMTAVLAGLGVPFARYVGDVLFVARAKSVPETVVLGQICAGLAYTLIVGKVDVQAAGAPFETARNVVARASGFARQYAFHGLVAVAIAMGSLGDFFGPFWPYAVVGLWAVVCSSKGAAAETPEPADRWLARNVTTAVIVVLGGFSLLSLQKTADCANSDTPKEAISEAISFTPRSLSFVNFPVSAGLDDLYASKLFAVPPDLPQRLFEYSYRRESDQILPAVQAIAILAGAGFVTSVNATANWLNAHGSAAKGTLAISHLGFANPWPLLTGNRFTAGSPHWLHVGTTVSPRQIDVYLEALSAADVTVVPLVSVNDPEQRIINCAFYDWNFRNGSRFVPQQLAGYNLIFVRKGGRLPVSEAEPVRIDASTIEQQCGDVLADTRTPG